MLLTLCREMPRSLTNTPRNKTRYFAAVAASNVRVYIASFGPLVAATPAGPDATEFASVAARNVRI